MSYQPEDFLCDRCYALWSTRDDDPFADDVMVGDFCDRCVDKLMNWILGDDLPRELIRFKTQ